MQSTKDLIDTTNFHDDLFAVSGSTIVIHRKVCTWCIFVAGGHIALCKLLGANGPTSLLKSPEFFRDVFGVVQNCTYNPGRRYCAVCIEQSIHLHQTKRNDNGIQGNVKIIV